MRWLVLASTALTIGVNALANALPIGGKTTGEISDGFQILFTPAGYVFSIWGLIYMGLIAFAIYQALPRNEERPALAAVRPWYLLNNVANAAWIVAWHHEQFWLTLPLMLAILGSLVVMDRHVGDIPPTDRPGFAFVRAPLALYLGWISVATIANTTVVLWVSGVTAPLTREAPTVGILLAATALCATVSLRRNNPIYAAVFVWALAGIAQKHQELPLLFPAAVACALACGVLTAWSASRLARADA